MIIYHICKLSDAEYYVISKDLYNRKHEEFLTTKGVFERYDYNMGKYLFSTPSDAADKLRGTIEDIIIYKGDTVKINNSVFTFANKYSLAV